MSKLSPQHYAAFGMLLSSIAAQGLSAHAWSEVFAPGFIFGSLGALGAVLVAIYSPKPMAPLTGYPAK